GPLGARHPTITPFQAFRTSDGSIIIAAGNDGLFVKTCEAIGQPNIAADPNYKTNALRLKHHTRLEHEMELALKGSTTAHWLAVLAKAGVPCGPINDVKQALEHPQVAARNMLVEVPDGSGGTLKLAGNPLKMSAFDDPTTRRPAPDLDSDPQAILSFVRGQSVRRLFALGAGLAKFLAGTALAILVFLVGAFFQVRGALPPYSGHVDAPGLKAPVEIVRDRNAVPHIIAGSLDDAAFGLGYVHAQDR